MSVYDEIADLYELDDDFEPEIPEPKTSEEEHQYIMDRIYSMGNVWGIE